MRTQRQIKKVAQRLAHVEEIQRILFLSKTECQADKSFSAYLDTTLAGVPPRAAHRKKGELRTIFSDLWYAKWGDFREEWEPYDQCTGCNCWPVERIIGMMNKE